MQLTAKVAKILRKDRKELKNMVLPLRILHFLAYFAVKQTANHE
jgi:hypothetical protein